MADVRDLGRELDPLADVDRAEEGHRVDGRRSDLPPAGMPDRGDRPALVGQAEQHAAVQRAVRGWPGPPR